ncbi:MAG: SRPBCC family protein [Planctomycetes bacterium]|nr:SRPBCC family protein [Planctomycetota bacterium]
MNVNPSFLWTWNRTIDRLPYLVTGIALFVVKFCIDWTVATAFYGRSWSVLNYLIWPNENTLRALDLSYPDRWFALTMVVISLPFVWSGVILTIHRLRAADLPLGLVLLFFVPLVNFLLFLVLIVEPTRATASKRIEPPLDAAHPRGLRRAHRRLTGESSGRSAALALAFSVPLTVVGVIVSAQVLGVYGFGLFLGAPFALGMCSVMIYGMDRPQPFGRCVSLAMAATVLAGVAILAFAIEGLICLLMASPIAFTLSFGGAVIGYTIQRRPWLSDHSGSLVLAIVLALPALMAAEYVYEPEADLRVVRTEVIVDASPETVWEFVVSFPALPEPDDWLFRAGVAYPQRAEIQGSGVGAVRHCVFSTGVFVEPIEIWEPPSLMRFRVTEQPEPMHEWSPYSIHPPHLDHYLVSRQGQFLLERLPDGRTRLEGATWYSNRMWPAPYWRLWSDHIIQSIHRRVLTHIRELSEARQRPVD